MHQRLAAAGAAAATGAALLLGPGAAFAAPPGEVTGVTFGPGSQISWTSVAGSNDYNIYRERTRSRRDGKPVGEDLPRG